MINVDFPAAFGPVINILFLISILFLTALLIVSLLKYGCHIFLKSNIGFLESENLVIQYGFSVLLFAIIDSIDNIASITPL